MGKNVTVRIGSKFDKAGVTEANAGLSGLKDKAQAVTTSIDKNFVQTAVKIYAAVKAVQAFYNQVNQLVAAYEVQDDAERKLSAAALNNPYINGRGVRSLKEFATEMQRLTRFGDEQIIQQEQWLVGLGYSEQQIKDVIAASADLASTGMFSLESAVRNVSKTFAGMTGELGEAIPALRDLTTEQLKAGGAVKIIAENYAGLAAAARASASGQRTAFQNLAGDVQEVIGSIFAALRSKLYTALTPILENIQVWFEDNAPAIYGVFANIPKIAAQAWQTAVEIMAKAFTGDVALNVLTLFGQYIKESLKLGLSQFPLLLHAVLGLAEDLWSAFGDNAGKYLVNGILNAITAGPRAVARLLGFEDVGARIDLFDIKGLRTQDFQEFLNNARATLSAVGIEAGNTIKAQMNAYRNMVGDIGELFGDEIDRGTTAILALIEAGAIEFRAFRDAAESATEAVQFLLREIVPENPHSVAGELIDYNVDVAPPKERDIGSMFGQVGSLLAGADPIMILVSAFAEAAMSVESVSAVLNGLTTALTATIEIVGPSLSAVLIPVIDLLILVGDSLGKLLAPILTALAPILGSLIQILSTVLVPIFQVLFAVLSPITMILEFLQPLFIGLAATLEVVMSPLRFVGDLLEWLGVKLMAFGEWIALIIQGKFGQAGKVDWGGAFSSDAFSGLAERVAAIWNMDTQASLGAGGIGDVTQTTGAGIYGGNTTFREAADINVHMYFEGNVIGPGGMAEVGEFVVDAIQEYAGVGGRVTFTVAPT